MNQHGGFDLGQPEARSSSAGASDGSFSKAVNYGRRLFQPRYWPQLGRLLARRLNNRPLDLDTAEEARRECAKLATDAEFAVVALGLPGLSVRSYATDHPERLAAARERVNGSGVWMGGATDVNLLYSLCMATGAVRALETGVALGWSSLVILSAIAPREGARLASVDLPYLGRDLDHLVGLAIPSDLKQHWRLYRGADRDQLDKAIAAVEPIDLAHYDSDKSYLGREWAYPRIWKAIKPGGLLLSDDVGDNLAFLNFARQAGAPPLIVWSPQAGNYLGVLRKAGTR